MDSLASSRILVQAPFYKFVAFWVFQLWWWWFLGNFGFFWATFGDFVGVATSNAGAKRLKDSQLELTGALAGSNFLR